MPTQTGKRTCESCGGAMPPRQSRQRDKGGRLVCDSCKGFTPKSGSAVLALLQAEAHDSGDNAIINHCPFCGSGGVVGSSNGTTTCTYCHTPFTVQVQSAHPFMPQTIEGQPTTPPGMPGDEPTEMSAPIDPAVEESDDDVAEDPLGDADPTAPDADPTQTSNGPVRPGQPPTKQPPANDQPPWLKKKTMLTAEGHVLPVEAYMQRLALEHADDRGEVLDAIRLANLAVTASAPGEMTSLDIARELHGTNPAPDRRAALESEKAARIQRGQWGVYTPGEPLADPESLAAKSREMARMDAEDDWQNPHYEWNTTYGITPDDMRSFKTSSVADDLLGSDPTPWGDLLSNDEPETSMDLLGPETLFAPRAAVPPFVREAAARQPLTKHQVKAHEIREGDFLDNGGKTRVHTVLPRGEQIHYAHRTTGTRSGSVSQAHRDAVVTIWRK